MWNEATGGLARCAKIANSIGVRWISSPSARCTRWAVLSKLGVTPQSTATSGAAFWAKAALQAGVRRSGLLKKQQKAKRPIEFKLDPKRPGAIIDLAAAAE